MGLMEKQTGRRDFLKAAALGGAGLVIGFRVEPGLLGRGAMAAAAAEPPGGFVPNAFVRIAPDSTITVLCKHIEFGQDHTPALPRSSPTSWMPARSRSR